MEEEKIKKIYEILNNIEVTSKNENIIDEIRKELLNEDYIGALKKIDKLSKIQKQSKEQESELDRDDDDDEKMVGIYPQKLSNPELEYTYMGLLLTDPKLIVKYYFVFEDCYFEDDDILNLYKSVLFTEGAAYASEAAKRGFNFSRDSEQVYKLKNELKAKVANKDYDMEKIIWQFQLKIFKIK